MENLQENLEFFSDDVRDFKDALNQKLDDVETRRAQERDKITRMTNDMKITIQRVEDKLVAENYLLFSQYEEYLKMSIDSSSQMEKELSAIRSEAEDAVLSGTKDETKEGILLHKYDSLQDRLVALQKGAVPPVFKPVKEDLLVVKSMDIGTFEHNEAQSEPLTIAFPSQRAVDVGHCFLTGLLWINNMFVVSDKANKKLKFFEENGSFLGELLFTNALPYGVCHIKDNSFAVSLPKARQIYIVCIQDKTARVLSSFQTYVGYAGLCKGLRVGSMIATMASNTPGESHVDIIGFRGEVFLSFKNDPQLGLPLFKFPRYVEAFQGVLIISDWRKDCVIFLHVTTGSILKEYRGTRDHPLINPYDVSLDERGNVYILNGKDGSVHVVDVQCNLTDVIKETSELLNPRLIAYDDASGRLAVTYGAGDIKTYHHRVPVPVEVEPESPPPHSPSFLLPPKSDAHARCPSPGF
ncbi:uncharacterized protein LOC123536455 [Mercenaria mercenaria]|uniref:uncharacterized protein LOC123536455 n=1 Tax=Mercenaria mercenaria TaxID=6596 RepID=UPI00234F9634|nr:uncharacterized protein LOC123536455 [Mercenaria mercenaria]